MKSKGQQQFETLVALLIAVMVSASIVFFAGYKDVAWVVGYGGTALVMFGGLIYATIDSKSRWPEHGFWTRMGAILTFARHPSAPLRPGADRDD